MSLNFDIGKIANWQDKDKHPAYPDRMHPVLDKLIWLCLATGMRGITAENVDEFWFRTRLIQLMDGPELVFGDGTQYCLTREDVAEHIGLSTNVTQEARAKWLGRLGMELTGPKQEGTGRALFDAKAAAMLAKAKAKEAAEA